MLAVVTLFCPYLYIERERERDLKSPLLRLIDIKKIETHRERMIHRERVRHRDRERRRQRCRDRERHREIHIDTRERKKDT